jgi:phosphoglycolate phosphatase-like HAD superfamily hydrolase
MMSHWQAVFFDFDGVILDSAGIKTRAFACMYRPFGPDIERRVVAYHEAHVGVSRFEKFRHFHCELLRRPVTEDLLQQLGREFSELVLREVLESPFIPGALETLEDLRSRSVPSYVVSGTPEDELRHIVSVRGLAPFFREVHGSPRRKPEILGDLLSRQRHDASQCLFLGDGLTDFHAAAAVGARFLGVVPIGSPSPFPNGTPTSSTVRA